MRTDVNLPDVITLVNAIAMASETTDARESDRMLGIVLAGIAASDPPATIRQRKQDAGNRKTAEQQA
ncbi:MAG: hypothetical protein JWQ86_2465 [Mycobacterium sp.]|nr:hypothetical protein [Mycobacterium sp.]MDT5212952.1 hypothetical protein [Mycobacterium sp.]